MDDAPTANLQRLPQKLVTKVLVAEVDQTEQNAEARSFSMPTTVPTVPGQEPTIASKEKQKVEEDKTVEDKTAKLVKMGARMSNKVNIEEEIKHPEDATVQIDNVGHKMSNPEPTVLLGNQGHRPPTEEIYPRGTPMGMGAEVEATEKLPLKESGGVGIPGEEEEVYENKLLLGVPPPGSLIMKYISTYSKTPKPLSPYSPSPHEYYINPDSNLMSPCRLGRAHLDLMRESKPSILPPNPGVLENSMPATHLQVYQQGDTYSIQCLSKKYPIRFKLPDNTRLILNMGDAVSLGLNFGFIVTQINGNYDVNPPQKYVKTPNAYEVPPKSTGGDVYIQIKWVGLREGASITEDLNDIYPGKLFTIGRFKKNSKVIDGMSRVHGQICYMESIGWIYEEVFDTKKNEWPEMGSFYLLRTALELQKEKSSPAKLLFPHHLLFGDYLFSFQYN